jgi:hypothetical protein
MIDTGAEATHLCQRFYERVTHTVADSLSETADSTILQVGDVSVPFFGIAIVDLDFMNESREKAGFIRLDGVIGSDVLRLGNAIIDIIGKTIFFKSPLDVEPINNDIINELLIARGPRGFNLIQMNLDAGLLICEAKINDVQGRFIVDSGANATVIDTAGADKFKMNMAFKDDTASGIHDAHSVKKVNEYISSLMGDTEIKIKPILMNLEALNEGMEEDGAEKVDGIIGTDILLMAVICYNNLRLYVINSE